MYSYIDLLAFIGVGGAHPGGLSLTKQLLEKIPMTVHTRVLDAGCGTGRTAAYIANRYGCHVTGIDSHALMLEKAAKRMLREGAPVQLVQGSIEQLPFLDASYSLILSESVVAFTEIDTALGELYRVLEPGGRLLLLEMTVERKLTAEEQKQLTALYGTREILTEQEWAARLQAAGFSKIDRLAGGTIAEQIQQYQEQPDWDLSPQLDPAIYHIWVQHESVIRAYSHVLGHRVLLCQK